jgi:uncharacterized protein
MYREDIVEKIRHTVREIDPNARIILFGSEARGEATSVSDIDVLILVDKNKLSWKEKEDFVNPLYDIELETGVLISPLVYTIKEWENRPFLTPFYLNVVNEGIVL